MVLEARDVSFAYGPGKWAIRNLTLSLDSPRRVALLGVNGVGKSTFMMLINGTLRPQEGQMRVLGQPIDYSRAGLQALHRRVGIVLQDPDDQLFGATVEQDVAFGPLNNGMEPPAVRKLVSDTLERMGIPHLADRPIHELSLGEKKRVALAGILVLRPSIILLDEPTAGLDFAGITAMLNLLDDLYCGGTALIVSTHDTDLAYEWADDAWILYKGSLAAQGPIADVVLNEILPDAHLRVPTMVELGRALREAHPELANQPLPRTREEMLEMIQRTGTEASAKPRLGDRTISTATPAAKVISFCPAPGALMASGVRKIALF
jgi:cobalt/nickel transport system ATP-binding protein